MYAIRSYYATGIQAVIQETIEELEELLKTLTPSK